MYRTSKLEWGINFRSRAATDIGEPVQEQKSQIWSGEPKTERWSQNWTGGARRGLGSCSSQLPVLQLDSPSARGPLRDRNADAEWVVMALQLVSEV